MTFFLSLFINKNSHLNSWLYFLALIRIMNVVMKFFYVNSFLIHLCYRRNRNLSKSKIKISFYFYNNVEWDSFYFLQMSSCQKMSSLFSVKEVIMVKLETKIKMVPTNQMILFSFSSSTHINFIFKEMPSTGFNGLKFFFL